MSLLLPLMMMQQMLLPKTAEVELRSKDYTRSPRSAVQTRYRQTNP